MDPIRELPAMHERVETGPVRFGNDWPGVFIRGDDAFYLFHAVKNVREHGLEHFSTPNALDRLQSILESCNLHKR